MRIFTLIILFFSFSAFADSDSVKIAAVVNDQVISSIDLDERTGLIMALSGIPDNEENRIKFTPQILRQLVDEKLQMQDATAHSITMNDTKLHEAIGRIEKQNNKAPGSLEAFIDTKHVSKPSFYEQVKAQAAWVELVNKEIKPKIRVSDQEVARYKSKSAPSENKEEVLINVIRLPVDSPANEEAVSKVAAKLADEIRSGVSFEDVATQFSSGSGGAKAPEPFWVEKSQLDPLIAAALAKVSKGGITEAVKTESGYQLIKLMDVRTKSAEANAGDSESRSELAFKQIVITAKPDAKVKDPETLLKLAKEVAASPGKCNEKTVSAKPEWADLAFDVTFIRRVSNSLPTQVHDVLMKLKVGGTSEPVVTPNDLRLFTLCERVDLPPEKAPASAEVAQDIAIRQKIYEEKLELEVQKYMRNLRRDAFVEVRQ